MKRFDRGRWFVLTVAAAVLIPLASGGIADAQQSSDRYVAAETSWTDIDWKVIPGLIEAPFSVRGWPASPRKASKAVVKRVKKASLAASASSNYVAPETSWTDLDWSVIPGLIEAPFSVRGWPAGPRKASRAVVKK